MTQEIEQLGAIVYKLDAIHEDVGSIRDDLRGRIERLHTTINSLHVDVASLRTELRAVAVALAAHEDRDLERFDAIHSDIRGLRESVERLEERVQHAATHDGVVALEARIMSVEDTSRSQALTEAQADAALAREQLTTEQSRTHNWLVVVVGVVVTLLASALTWLTSRAFGDP